MNEELFNDILDDDEKIISVYKPDKKRYVLVNSLIAAITALIIGVIFFLVGYFAYSDYLKGVKDAPLELAISLFVFSALALLVIIIYPICINIVYKKTYYAVSNKRVIIRSGFIGVDYKTLDMTMIGSHDVSVSFFDKLVKPNTGSLRFGSTSAPVLEKGASFSFDDIKDPYKVYKSIKEIVDKAKKSY